MLRDVKEKDEEDLRSWRGKSVKGWGRIVENNSISRLLSMLCVQKGWANCERGNRLWRRKCLGGTEGKSAWICGLIERNRGKIGEDFWSILCMCVYVRDREKQYREIGSDLYLASDRASECEEMIMVGKCTTSEIEWWESERPIKIAFLVFCIEQK